MRPSLVWECFRNARAHEIAPSVALDDQMRADEIAPLLQAIKYGLRRLIKDDTRRAWDRRQHKDIGTVQNSPHVELTPAFSGFNWGNCD